MAIKRGEDMVTEGSGNVFADPGVAEPAEELAKAQLASPIREAIKRRKLTQAAAAVMVGLDQPKIQVGGASLRRQPTSPLNAIVAFLSFQFL